MKRTLPSLPLVLLSSVTLCASFAPVAVHARTLIPDQPSVEIRLEALRLLRSSMNSSNVSRDNPFQTPPSAPLVQTPPVYQPPVFQPQPQPSVAMAPPAITQPAPVAPLPVAPAPKPIKPKAHQKPQKPIADLKAQERIIPDAKQDVYIAKTTTPPQVASPTKKEKAAKSKPLPVVEETLTKPAEMDLSLGEIMNNKADVINTPPPSMPAPSLTPKEITPGIAEKKADKKIDKNDEKKPSLSKNEATLPEPVLKNTNAENAQPSLEKNALKNKNDEPEFLPLPMVAGDKKMADLTTQPPLSALPLQQNTAKLEEPSALTPLFKKEPVAPEVKKQELKKETVKNPKKDAPKDVPKDNLSTIGEPLLDKSMPSLADLDALPDVMSNDVPPPLASAPMIMPSAPIVAKEDKNAKSDKKPDNTLPELANNKTNAGVDSGLVTPPNTTAEKAPDISALPTIGNNAVADKETSIAKATRDTVIEKTDSQVSASSEAPKKEGFLPNLKSSFASFLGRGDKKAEPVEPESKPSVAPAISSTAMDPSAQILPKDVKDTSGLPTLPDFNSPTSPKAVPALGTTSSLPPLPAFGSGGEQKGADSITTDEALPPLPFGTKTSDAKQNVTAKAENDALPKEEKVASLNPPKTTDMALPPLKEPVMSAEGRDGASLSVLFSQSETEVPLAFQQPLINMSKELVGNDTKIKVIAYASGSDDQKSIARRISLARALAVRAFLIDLGVDNVRISVQALGNDVKKGPSERADVILLSKG